MKEMYFTIAGCSHYCGNDFMKKGMKVKLVKEQITSMTRKQSKLRLKAWGNAGM